MMGYGNIIPVSYTHLDVYKRQLNMVLFPKDIKDILPKIHRSNLMVGKANICGLAIKPASTVLVVWYGNQRLLG